MDDLRCRRCYGRGIGAITGGAGVLTELRGAITGGVGAIKYAAQCGCGVGAATGVIWAPLRARESRRQATTRCTISSGEGIRMPESYREHESRVKNAVKLYRDDPECSIGDAAFFFEVPFGRVQRRLRGIQSRSQVGGHN